MHQEAADGVDGFFFISAAPPPDMTIAAPIDLV
jgi:hypothetical protein